MPTRTANETLRALAVGVVASALACGSGLIGSPDAASNEAAQAKEAGSEASVRDATVDAAAGQDADGSSVVADVGDGGAKGDGPSTAKSDGDAACAYDGYIPNAGCCKTGQDCPSGTCCSGAYGLCILDCGPQ